VVFCVVEVEPEVGRFSGVKENVVVGPQRKASNEVSGGGH